MADSGRGRSETNGTRRLPFIYVISSDIPNCLQTFIHHRLKNCLALCRQLFKKKFLNKSYKHSLIALIPVLTEICPCPKEITAKGFTIIRLCCESLPVHMYTYSIHNTRTTVVLQYKLANSVIVKQYCTSLGLCRSRTRRVNVQFTCFYSTI